MVTRRLLHLSVSSSDCCSELGGHEAFFYESSCLRNLLSAVGVMKRRFQCLTTLKLSQSLELSGGSDFEEQLAELYVYIGDETAFFFLAIKEECALFPLTMFDIP